MAHPSWKRPSPGMDPARFAMTKKLYGRVVSRLYPRLPLPCAQCHKHPVVFVDDTGQFLCGICGSRHLHHPGENVPFSVKDELIPPSRLK